MLESGEHIKTLVLRLKQSDEAAFRSLYDCYKARLYRYCLNFTKCEEDAKEIVQDVFIKLWEERENLNVESNLSSFLFCIAKNKLINKFRKAALTTAYLKEQKQITSEVCSATEAELEFGNYLELVKRAITLLPPQRKLIFTMSRQQELSHQEIALTLGISKNTVKEQIAKALKFLRVCIK